MKKLKLIRIMISLKENKVNFGKQNILKASFKNQVNILVVDLHQINKML